MWGLILSAADKPLLDAHLNSETSWGASEADTNQQTRTASGPWTGYGPCRVSQRLSSGTPLEGSPSARGRGVEACGFKDPSREAARGLSRPPAVCRRSSSRSIPSNRRQPFSVCGSSRIERIVRRPLSVAVGLIGVVPLRLYFFRENPLGECHNSTLTRCPDLSFLHSSRESIEAILPGKAMRTENLSGTEARQEKETR